MIVQIIFWLRRLVFVFLFVTISLSGSNKISLSFDQPFPQTPFVSALNGSMQILGEIECLDENNQDLKEFNLIDDVIVGKLFHVRVCIENIKDQKSPVFFDDIEYLDNLVSKIAAEYKRVFRSHLNKARSNYIVEFIKDIQARLRKLSGQA